MRLEFLEPRLALALVPAPLVITGTPGIDVINVSPVAGSPIDVTYTVNGTPFGPVRPAGPIQISGQGGNDQITIAAGVYLPAIIDGGFGDDTLQGGSGDDLFLVRDGLLDTINGGLGIDRAATDSEDLVTSIEHLNPIPQTVTNQVQRVKILVVNFDPQVPSQQNRRLYDIFGWNNPRSLIAGYEADLERASGGAIEYEIVEWRDLDEIPAFSDGSRYTPDQYYQNRLTNSNWNTTSSADFPRIMAEQNIAPLIDSGEVDEVWFFGDHFFALPGESWMAGPNSFFINGPTYPQIQTQRAFACMGFSYERGVAEMLHNHGHRTESTMNRIYGGWNLPSPVSNWDRFSANFNQSNGVAGVGTTHWPANAEGDYDTFNPRIVQSWADDYLNYPTLTFATQPVSRTTWGKGANPDYERSYQNWYYAHLPRASGVNADAKQNNWWKYLYNFENYTSSGQPKPLFATAQVDDLFNLGSSTYQFRIAYSGAVPVQLNTIDGSDVIVSGPNGFLGTARLVGTSDATDDVYVVATYEITAPGGTWDAGDNGNYSIQLQNGQVGDVLGSMLPASAIGSFNVRGTTALPLVNDADTLLLLPVDGSPNGAAGEVPTFSSGVTYEAGRVNQAAVTSSTGRLVYDQSGNIVGPAGTVEFWIRPNWNADGTSRQFFEAGNAFNNGMLMSIDGARNLRFIQWGDNPLTVPVETNVERGVGVSGSTWQSGQWHHLAATWDSVAQTMAFYVDGVLAGTSSTVTIPAFTNTTLSFGARRDGSVPAVAAFDEIRISNRARSAGEIQADFAAGIRYVSLTTGMDPGSLTVGGQVPFFATATDDFGGTYDVSQQVLWASSAPSVATINALGELRGIAAGPTTVSAQLGSLTANQNVNISDLQRPTYQLLNDGAVVSTHGSTAFDLVVRYTDNNAVLVNSLGFGDIRVRNTQGYSFFATLLGVDTGTNGSPRQATYRVTPPGGYWDPSDNGTYIVELKDIQVFDTLGTAAGGAEVLGTFTAAVPVLEPSTFQVVGFAPTSTGVVLDFSRNLDAATLNLYDIQGGVYGPADVVLQGATVGAIRGSVVIDPSLRRLTFIATTGRLPADTYTLTLRSAADGFRDAGAVLLDGDSNLVAGGNFVHTYAVTAPPANVVTLSVPNIARGPQQPVNVPANGTSGLPISFSDGGGITSATFQLRYNPALLTITSATVAPGLPVGATVNINTSTPGVAVIQFSSPTALAAGTTRFIDLQASVPITATYRTKHVLDIGNIVLNAGAIPAIDDDALHIAAYFGDTTGNGLYSATDASRISRVAVAFDTGFQEYKLLDPWIIGDISGAGGISSTDASRALQLAVAFPVAEVPPLPIPSVSLTQGGPDPKLSIPTDLAAVAGGELIVPVNIDSIVDLTGTGLESADLVIYYDAAVLDVTSASLGSLVANRGNWMIATRIDALAGRIFVSLAGNVPLEGFFQGELVQLHATVKATAPAGASAINLAASARNTAQYTQLNEGYLTLIPAPTNAADDPGVDGLLTIINTLPPSQQPTATLVNDQLLITGTNDDDHIFVAAIGHDQVRVRAGNRLLGTFNAPRGIAINALGGSDHVFVAPTIRAAIAIAAATSEPNSVDQIFASLAARLIEQSELPAAAPTAQFSAQDQALLQLLVSFSDNQDETTSPGTNIRRRR